MKKICLLFAVVFWLTLVGSGFAQVLGPGLPGSGGAKDFSELTGTATDAQIPNLNTLSTGLTASRCVETDGSSLLTVAAGACGVGGYTDEQAQDAVGTILTDTATINFTYTDATPTITADVIDGSITAAKVAADVATQAELDANAAATYITQTCTAVLSAEQCLSALATGIVKSTTTTGVLSIAVAGDFPTLNQNTTGSAATATTAATITGLLTSSNIPKADILQASTFATSAGATNAYTATPSPAITAYVDGTQYRFQANAPNTGAATIAISGLAAVPIVKYINGGSTALIGGEICQNQVVNLAYGSGAMQIQNGLCDSLNALSDITWLGSHDFSSAGVTGIIVTEADTLDTVFERGKEIDGANSSTNAVKIGNGTNRWYIYNDATLGLQFNCFITTEGNCDYFRQLNSTKKWGVKNSAGTEIFTVTENTGAITNAKYDVEGTGNVFTTTRRLWFPVAACQNAVASLIWDSLTTNAAAAACVTGSNTNKGVADYDATTDEGLQMTYLLPTTWTGTIDARIMWFAAATTGAAGLCVQLVAVADGETDDPAFPAQAAGNCASTTAKGTTLQVNTSTITGVSCTTCAAGELLHIRLSRDADGGAVTDSMTGDARVIGLELTIREAL